MQSLQEGYGYYVAALNSLTEENTRLKKIVAEQALEIQIKKELINRLGTRISEK
jgi:hypothetical protein